MENGGHQGWAKEPALSIGLSAKPILCYRKLTVPPHLTSVATTSKPWEGNPTILRGTLDRELQVNKCRHGECVE